MIAITVSGCGLFGSNGDMANNGSTDMTMPPPGSDLTMPPGLVDVSFDIHDDTHLFNQVNCDDPRAQITSIQFVVTSQATGGMATSSLPCPSGMYTGGGSIALPANMGFFNATATTQGKVSSQATVMDYDYGNGSISFHFYIFPVDMG